VFSRTAEEHLVFEFGIPIPSVMNGTMSELNIFYFAPFYQGLDSISDLASLNL